VDGAWVRGGKTGGGGALSPPGRLCCVGDQQTKTIEKREILARTRDIKKSPSKRKTPKKPEEPKTSLGSVTSAKNWMNGKKPGMEFNRVKKKKMIIKVCGNN